MKEKFNANEAYRKTFPKASKDSAEAHSWEVANRGEVKIRVLEIAQAKGLTLEALIDDLNDCRKAFKDVFHEGKQIASVPDFGVRLESIKTGFKMYGVLGNVDTINNVDARSVQIQLSADDAAKLSDTLRELRSLTPKRAKLDEQIGGKVDSGGGVGEGERGITSP